MSILVPNDRPKILGSHKAIPKWAVVTTSHVGASYSKRYWPQTWYRESTRWRASWTRHRHRGGRRSANISLLKNIREEASGTLCKCSSLSMRRLEGGFIGLIHFESTGLRTSKTLAWLTSAQDPGTTRKQQGSGLNETRQKMDQRPRRSPGVGNSIPVVEIRYLGFLWIVMELLRSCNRRDLWFALVGVYFSWGSFHTRQATT